MNIDELREIYNFYYKLQRFKRSFFRITDMFILSNPQDVKYLIKPENRLKLIGKHERSYKSEEGYIIKGSRYKYLLAPPTLKNYPLKITPIRVKHRKKALHDIFDRINKMKLSSFFTNINSDIDSKLLFFNAIRPLLRPIEKIQYIPSKNGSIPDITKISSQTNQCVFFWSFRQFTFGGSRPYELEETIQELGLEVDLIQIEEIAYEPKF